LLTFLRHATIGIASLLAVGLASAAQVEDAKRSAGKLSQIQLFTAPDESSALVASVGPEAGLSPMAETLGAGGEKWHLVKSKSGLVGWIKASDTEESKKLESFFKSLPTSPTVFSPGEPSSPSSTARPHGVVEVPVDARGSLVIVPVTFNGSVTANLALDTGATTTLVSRRIATSLALHNVGSATGITVGGPVTRPIARLESLKVGAAEVRNLLVSIHDFHPDPRVEGLLGLDFLRHFQVSLDARKQLLTLSPR
jgi:predicted aspartyl protease